MLTLIMLFVKGGGVAVAAAAGRSLRGREGIARFAVAAGSSLALWVCGEGGSDRMMQVRNPTGVFAGLYFVRPGWKRESLFPVGLLSLSSASPKRISRALELGLLGNDGLPSVGCLNVTLA